MCIVLLASYTTIYCQPSNFQTPVSINEDGTNPDKNAILDLQSKNKGLLIPRMPYCDIEQISDPIDGLMIYDTEFHCLRIYIQGRWQCLYQKLDGPNAELNITGWANPTFDEDFNTSIAVDSKENTLVTMVTEDDEIRLTKFDKKGNILWNILEKSGSSHGSAAVDLNDNVFTVASSEYNRDRPISFNGATSNDTGYFITKTSPDGTNTKIFTLPNAEIYDLVIDKDGNVLFVFTFKNSIVFDGVAYNDEDDNAVKVGVAKLNNNLDEVWIKLWDVFMNDIYESTFATIDVDHKGNVCVVGRHRNGVSFTTIEPNEIRNNNIYVTNLSAANGSPMWTENYGSESRLNSINVEFFKLYSGGNFLVSVTESSTGKLLHYSADGGFLNSTSKLPGKVSGVYIAANDTRREIAVSYVEDEESVAFYLAPVKLLIFNYDNNFTAPKKTVYQTFNYPSGDLSFNQDGSKIYGIAKGKTAGNTTIEQQPGSENHIIYKVYNE